MRLTMASLSKWMLPEGQASRHILQPAQAWESISIAPVSGFRDIAPAGQISVHQPSLQWMQVQGMHTLSLG